MSSSYLDLVDKSTELENSKVRVYAKTAVNSCVVTQMVTCALRSHQCKDILFVKETVLELLELTPEGVLVSLFEQPIFGTVKNVKVLKCKFSGLLFFDSESGNVYHELELSSLSSNKKQCLRVIPGQDVLVCVSDSGKGKNVPSMIGSNAENSRKSGRFQPIKETKEYSQYGVIWQMDFLYPSDESHILLAMIVFSEIYKQANVIIYKFWANDEPEKNILAYSKLPLSEDSPLPLHLIPLPNYPECFLLINENDVCFLNANEVIVGNLDFYKERLPIADSTSSSKTINNSKTSLNPIGIAMTSISSNSGDSDYVILSGEMSDGAVVLVEKTNCTIKATMTCKIPNWAPVLDFQMLDFHHEWHDVILACSGYGKHGSIRELRRAIGVNVITKTEPDFNGVNCLWNLKYDSRNDLTDSFLALSFTNSTRLMYIGKYGELECISDRSGLDLECSSLCIVEFIDLAGWLIQIHRNAVNMIKICRNLDLMKEESSPSENLVQGNLISRWIPPKNTIIEVASVYQSIIICSLSSSDGKSILIALKVNYDKNKEDLNGICYTQIGEYILDSQSFNIPESACIIGNFEKAYFLIGLREGTIVYFKFSWSTGIKKICLNNNNNNKTWQIEHSHHMGLTFSCIAFEQYEHTPNRLYFDDYYKVFIVICTNSFEEIPNSVLKIVDPLNGKIIYEYSLFDQDNPNKCQTVYSITGWQSTTDTGRLILFQIRKILLNNKEYELKKINQTNVNGIVCSMCPLNDRYLLIGSGNTLNLLKFYYEEKKIRKVLSKELRWPIISINAKGRRICVGTQKGSLSFYEFDVERESITFLKAERMSRLIKDSIMLNEDLAIGSDKCGNVFGLLYNEAEIVSRLRVVYLGYRSDNITYSTTSLSSSAAVIGCSLLGSVFLFVRVNLKSYKLLRVLQTILEKWPTTRPVLGNDNSKFRSDHNATKLNFVIDGEMVSQFLRLSKQEQFRIIEKHPELIKAGKIFIHGENWFYGKSEEVIMAKYVTNVEEKKEVGNDLMDEEEIDEMNYIGETIKQRLDDKQLVAIEEIVEVIHIVLSELNMQVS
ncbi:8264_t:CDS:10 [Entrophospora sp. SA101]|nr:8264_t:CDS:10 [Entrophospora sp. SA101]